MTTQHAPHLALAALVALSVSCSGTGSPASKGRAPAEPVARAVPRAGAPAAAPATASAPPAAEAPRDGVTTADGTVTIRGERGFAIHTHGGDSAYPASARYTVTNSGPEARTLILVRVELLHGRECGRPPTDVAATLSARALTVAGEEKASTTAEEKASTTAEVTVEPGKTVELVAQFEPASVYYTYCDEFGFRAHFHVDGEELRPVAPLDVEREEPMQP